MSDWGKDHVLQCHRKSGPKRKPLDLRRGFRIDSLLPSLSPAGLHSPELVCENVWE